ncbi:MAG: sulfatase [Bacteroidetes bacterium]|nr:sulfatase [Bacteroidota bacterium]
MMKTNWIVVFILISLFGCSGQNGKSGSAVEHTDKNLLFIVVDDLTTTLGCYDHPVVKTPHIDRLADMGIRFNHAYCNFAVCNPSRSSFLTGMTPETTTIQDNRVPLQSVIGEWVSMPFLFKQHGFYTMSLGKIFHGTTKPEHNDLKGWDEIYGYKATETGRKGEGRNLTDGVLKWCHWRAAEGDDEDQADGQIAKKAVEFIKAEHEKPFFLAVGFHKPHDPFVAPKKYFDLYPLEDCVPPELPEGWEAPYKHTLPGETSEFNKFTDLERREFLRSYYACCTFMDAQVGKVILALEESGQMDNTLIVFLGDHGYHLGEHNWWNKVTVFEKGTKAPFIVAGQSAGKKGVESDAMFEFIDIYPTLAELFNLEAPDHLEGESFASVIGDPSLPFRNEVRAMTRRGEMAGKTVKTAEWRYVEWDGGERGSELYDQADDPMEYRNLADDTTYADVVHEMKSLLNEAR